MKTYLRKKVSVCVVIVFWVIAIDVLAADIDLDIYRGKFINYPETDYEGVFIPCSAGEVWSVVEDEYYFEILDIYNNNPLSEYGALYFELKGDVESIDRVKYPQSHISAFFTVNEIIGYSSDEVLIDRCNSKE